MADEKRQPKLGIVVGRKGVGKTYTTVKMLRSYIAGDPKNGLPGHKVLILDVNDEYGPDGIKRVYPKGEFSIKTLDPRHIAWFTAHKTVEARRIRPIDDNGRPLTTKAIADLLLKILHEYRGGLLLIEDYNSYIGDSPPNDIIGTICKQRHLNMDVVLHLQSIGRIIPKLWQNANWMRFHKNSESVDKHAKQKFPDRHSVMKLVEILVNNRYKQGDERFFVYVDLDYDRIMGNFTKEEFEEVCLDLIGMQSNSILKPLLSKIDRNGNPVHDRKSAVEYALRELVDEHYGNRDAKVSKEKAAILEQKKKDRLAQRSQISE